ncbi:MAG: substrate-binding domain-containing protein [Propionibacteriaceae bacterium]|jgi:ribose transport system substrate-binding protein|nr:substrate-binding domain-containing protein [Propionibacteriaceae bacterium]
MPKLVSAFVALLCFALSGCTAEFGSSTIYVLIVGKSTQGKYWEAVQSGAKVQAESEHIKIRYVAPDSPDDVEGQLRLLREALNTRPSAIAFAPISPTSAVSMAKEATKAGIPFIAFDTQLEGVNPTVTVATNNNTAAAEAARHMCDLIGGGGSVATVSDALGHHTEIDRYIGFRDGLREDCPKVVLLDPITLDGDEDAGLAAFQSSLKKQKPAGVLFTSADAAGKILADWKEGEENPVLIGFDSGAEQIKAIRSGVMAGAIAQNPTGMGAQVVTSALRLIENKPLPRLVDTGFFWYDKENIDKPAIQAVIAE